MVRSKRIPSESSLEMRGSGTFNGEMGMGRYGGPRSLFFALEFTACHELFKFSYRFKVWPNIVETSATLVVTSALLVVTRS